MTALNRNGYVLSIYPRKCISKYSTVLPGSYKNTCVTLEGCKMNNKPIDLMRTFNVLEKMENSVY